jgi:hypothetical protein
MIQLANRRPRAGGPPPPNAAGARPDRAGSSGREIASILRRKSVSPVALVLTLIAGGCAGERTVVENASPQAVPIGRAFVSLGPGSPAALFAVNTPYENAIRQTITLATHGRTPGENQLRVDVVGLTNNNLAADTTLPDTPLSEAELIVEAQDALPDVPLRTSLNYLQNRYGPFGYAVGRSRQGDTCIYGWQRVATSDEKLTIANSRDVISIRLRLCDPKASEAALAATMMNLSVAVNLSSGGWAPDPRPLSPDIGAPNAPIAPEPILAAAENPLPPAPSGASYRAASVAPAPEPVQPLSAVVQPPVVVGVVVPPPPLPASNASAQSPVFAPALAPVPAPPSPSATSPPAARP